jgi:Domain of unknown function (DUF4129)
LADGIVVHALKGKPRSPGNSHRLALLLPLDCLFWFTLILVPLLYVPDVNAQAPPDKPGAPPLDLQSFQTELARIQQTLQAKPSQPDQIAALEKNLPTSWQIETPERTYDISAEPLHSLLDAARNAPVQRSQRLSQAQEWLAELASEVNAYAATGQASPPDARAKLEKILSSPGFGTVYRQTAWDRFKQRVASWIWQKVGELLRRMSGHPIAARAMAWLILLLAVAGVALLLFRAWTRHAKFAELKAPPAPIIQSWQEWIHLAELAADRSAYRDAVHALYWAGIVYLENARILLREPSRTPRERLRQLRSPAQPTAEDVKRRDLLQALTSGLERVWYAGTPATRQDFLESSRLVQELGCRWQ